MSIYVVVVVCVNAHSYLHFACRNSSSCLPLSFPWMPSVYHEHILCELPPGIVNGICCPLQILSTEIQKKSLFCVKMRLQDL